MKKSLIAAIALVLATGLGATQGERIAGAIRYRLQPAPKVSDEPFNMPLWDARVVEFKKEPNKAIVMLGDSRVQGMDWPKALKRGNVSNRGISSETTPYTLKRLDVSIPRPAQVVFTQVGINDVARGLSDEKILQDYAVLIDRLKSKSKHVVVGSVVQVGSKYQPWHARVAVLNPKLQKLTLSHGALWVDLNPTLCPGGYLLDTKDGIHFGSGTYRKWAAILDKQLDAMKL